MSKIQSFLRKITHPFYPLRLNTPVAIIIAALLLSISHVAYGFIVNNSSTQAQIAYFTGRPVDATDHVEGKAASDVVIVAYSDPECPYCITLYPTLKQVRMKYEDKVAFVYRHFPLTQIHPHAYDESKAIACAGVLGGTSKYYEYMDKIYGYKAEKNDTQLPATGKEDIAKNVGLDATAFTACEASDTTSLAIDTSLNDGVQAGVQGTPSTFVLSKTRKGYEVIAMIDGARPQEYFEAAIEQALSR